MMTYRELRDRLRAMDEDQLDHEAILMGPHERETPAGRPGRVVVEEIHHLKTLGDLKLDDEGLDIGTHPRNRPVIVGGFPYVLCTRNS